MNTDITNRKNNGPTNDKLRKELVKSWASGRSNADVEALKVKTALKAGLQSKPPVIL